MCVSGEIYVPEMCDTFFNPVLRAASHSLRVIRLRAFPGESCQSFVCLRCAGASAKSHTLNVADFQFSLPTIPSGCRQQKRKLNRRQGFIREESSTLTTWTGKYLSVRPPLAAATSLSTFSNHPSKAPDAC